VSKLSKSFVFELVMLHVIPVDLYPVSAVEANASKTKVSPGVISGAFLKIVALLKLPVQSRYIALPGVKFHV
jgi:hypothetical protein